MFAGQVVKKHPTVSVISDSENGGKALAEIKNAFNTIGISYRIGSVSGQMSQKSARNPLQECIRSNQGDICIAVAESPSFPDMVAKLTDVPVIVVPVGGKTPADAMQSMISIGSKFPTVVMSGDNGEHAALFAALILRRLENTLSVINILVKTDNKRQMQIATEMKEILEKLGVLSEIEIVSDRRAVENGHVAVNIILEDVRKAKRGPKVPSGINKADVDYHQGIAGVNYKIPSILVPCTERPLSARNSSAFTQELIGRIRPNGVPVGIMGFNGSENAALFAAHVLAMRNGNLREGLNLLLRPELVPNRQNEGHILPPGFYAAGGRGVGVSRK